VDDESSLSGTSVGVDATSGHLAVRVLCNLMVGGPYSAVTVRWGGRLANALWTDPERPRDRCQRGCYFWQTKRGWDSLASATLY
jgi:hypothetical protein